MFIRKDIICWIVFKSLEIPVVCCMTLSVSARFLSIHVYDVTHQPHEASLSFIVLISHGWCQCFIDNLMHHLRSGTPERGCITGALPPDLWGGATGAQVSFT